MEKVMVFGTFDILHDGHLNFFKQAGKYGTLIIVVARDKNVERLKGRLPKNNERKRKRSIESLRLGKVVLGDLKDPYKIIRQEKPDVICLGYDQQHFTKHLKTELVKAVLATKIKRLRPYNPQIYKSSKLDNAKRL